MEKKLTLTESEVNGFIKELAEIPAKWSYSLIQKIQYNFSEQNKEEKKEAK